MKIFAISGLGADHRVFNYLTLNHELIPVEWIKPNKKESIITYAKRLIKDYKIDKEQEFGIMGVSFGGLIAVEISKILNPKVTILISSAETKKEFHKIIRFLGKIKIIEIIPKRFLNPPKFIAHYLFGTKNKKLLNAILDDTDLDFTKWAVREIMNWQNETKLNNVIKIAGSNDKMLLAQDKNSIIIENGKHFMIVDQAKLVSEIINKKIETDYNTK